MKTVPQQSTLHGQAGPVDHWLLITSLQYQVSSLGHHGYIVIVYHCKLVNETLEELISGLCRYGDDVYHYDDKVFGFENASADGLDGWRASRPSITTLDPFCGRRSLHVSN